MTKRLAALISIALLATACGKKKAAPAAGTPTAAVGSASGDAAASGSAGDAGLAADPVGAAVNQAVVATGAVLAPPADRAARGARAGALIDRVVADVRARPRDAWDPSAVVAQVGTDRAALFQWVRDHTALVPYAGSLRGAVGVMMDRVGNSLDRALLLADLLGRAGLEVRLATARLDDAQVGKLVAALAARPRPALPAQAAPEVPIDGFAQDLAVEPAVLRARVATLDQAVAAVAERARRRIGEQALLLGKLLPAAPAPSATDAAGLAEHWWVQVHDGEAWSDLDPSLPDAAPGEPLASDPIETLAPAELSDDRRHTVTVRVIGELWSGGARQEVVLVEHTFAPALFYGQRIAVANVAVDMPSLAALVADHDPLAALRRAVVAQTEWVPVVSIGDHPVVHLSVTDAGETYDALDPNGNTTRLARAVQRATKQGVGAATDLLGTLPDDPQAASPTPQPAVAPRTGFTAEWLEVEVRSPGREPETARRLVFDALGLATDRAGATQPVLDEPARLGRGLALVGETELLPMFAQLPAAFVADRVATALAAARPVIVDLLAGTAAAPDALARAQALSWVPGPLYQVALHRFGWNPTGDAVYLDRPSVLAERRRIELGPAGATVSDVFDVMTNTVAVWPSRRDRARELRITQGVADTAVEAAVMDCSGRPGCVRTPNASERFTAAPAWTVAPAGWASGLPPAARALAERDLTGGYVLIVPAGKLAQWWRARPATGEVLGMGATGGTAASEYAFMIGQGAVNLYMCIPNLDHANADAPGTPEHEWHAYQASACAASMILGAFSSVGLAVGVAELRAGSLAIGWLSLLLTASTRD